jgi:hypothetical protein
MSWESFLNLHKSCIEIFWQWTLKELFFKRAERERSVIAGRVTRARARVGEREGEGEGDREREGEVFVWKEKRSHCQRRETSL